MTGTWFQFSKLGLGNPDLAFGVWGLGFRVWDLGLGFQAQGFWFGWGLGFGVWGLGFRG